MDEEDNGAAEVLGGEPEPSPEDIELCSKPSIDRSVQIDELCRLLGVFKNYPNKRYPAKPEVVLVDMVVMAVRGCSSVVKARQDAAIAAGVAPLLVAVLTGPHLKDRETCLRTSQCLLGIMGKNDDAVAAFWVAGCKKAMEGVVAQARTRALAIWPRPWRSLLRTTTRHHRQRPTKYELLVIDRQGNYRGYVDQKGTFFNSRDETIGFLNMEANTAGSIDDEFLGCVQDQVVGDECVIENSSGDSIAILHLGSSRILDNQGSTVVEFEPSGKFCGNFGSSLGQLDGFSYKNIRVAALYLLFIDPGMLSEAG